MGRQGLQYMGLEPLGSTWRKMKLLSPFTLHYASGLIIYIYEKQKCKTTGKKKETILMTLAKGKKQKA